MVEGLLWVFFVWWIVVLLLVFLYLVLVVFWCYFKVLCFIFGILIIVLFFWGMLVLCVWYYVDNYYSGVLWLLYVMILVWGVDFGVYMFGKMFGKYKLVLKVLLGKIWQGFFGGLLIVVVIFWVYGVWVYFDVMLMVLLVCLVVVVLVLVLGDLMESMFKCEVGIKDSGYLIFGYGGIFDCIDSLMVVVLVFVCLLLLVFRMI